MLLFPKYFLNFEPQSLFTDAADCRKQKGLLLKVKRFGIPLDKVYVLCIYCIYRHIQLREEVYVD